MAFSSCLNFLQQKYFYGVFGFFEALFGRFRPSFRSNSPLFYAKRQTKPFAKTVLKKTRNKFKQLLMKKLLLLAAAFVCLFSVKAQNNLQTFYDFNRKCITTTLEGFHTDNWGNTFFFIDYDYQLDKANGTLDSPNNTYFEIARCLNFWQDSKLSALSFHVEYNGGFGMFYSVNHAILLGADYFLHSRDFSHTLNLKVLYKKFRNLNQQLPMQLTAVWGCQDIFNVKGLRFSGFADLWWESQYVFLTEPQLWYAFGEHFNLGGEVELSSNFAGTDGFAVRPCLGAKWVF